HGGDSAAGGFDPSGGAGGGRHWRAGAVREPCGPEHPPFSRCRCDRNSRKGLLDLTWAYPVRERKVLGQLKLTGEQIALTAARAADDKRGSGIVVLDLRDISLMTDYFVIVDASSEAQVRAITEGIQEALEAEGVAAYRREGWEDARWVLLDYGD